MKYVISYDVRVAGLIEVEAADEEEAEEAVLAMDPSVLLKNANMETIDVIPESVRTEDPETP